MGGAPANTGDAPGADADALFAGHLARGTEGIATGDLESAQLSLEKALELRPHDPGALGLLGQALYTLGRFDEAAAAYDRLVRETPAEAAARVNLGLALLKARRYPEAVRQLEVALDLHPEHKKAMGYLGLAWLEQADFEQARGWFARAGSDQMVARCDELIAIAQPQGSSGAAQPEPEPTAAVAAATPRPPTGLAAFAAARLVSAPEDFPFDVGGQLLSTAVRGSVLVRAQGLVAVRGPVRLLPEMKHFRGRSTEKPVGKGALRMLRASGEGSLLHRRSRTRLTVLDLDDDSAYVREEAVFGFEDDLAFENGRIASPRAGVDLNLVHLRGQGRVLLATAGDMAAVEVTREGPVRIPVEALVAWTGSVTPRLVPLADVPPEEEASEPLAVELSGEGRALLDPGSAG